MPHRVPSPRELAMHTQHIIQNALIKKKLEEQHENFRKRQEQQRAGSPANSSAKQTMSPTPLAFTPTSVLRKMTADKEPDGANLSQVESFQNFINDRHLKAVDSELALKTQFLARLLSIKNNCQESTVDSGFAVSNDNNSLIVG